MRALAQSDRIREISPYLPHHNLRTVLQCLGQMRGLNLVTPSQIRNCTRLNSRMCIFLPRMWRQSWRGTFTTGTSFWAALIRRAGCVLNGLTGRISRNGQGMPPVIELQALKGDIIDIVSHTANLPSRLGETLRAGEVIITGSIVPPLLIESGDEIHYDLDPIDTVSIHVR